MSYLEQYRLKVKALSPVFIGSGINLTKKEYLFIPQEKRIVFVGLHKFYELLESKKLTGAYEDFIMGNQKDLYMWLMSNRLTQNEIHSIQSYVINAGNAMDTASGTNLTGIQLFIKDPFGQPYLPGSSLKGAVRTALLADMTEKRDYSSHLSAYQSLLTERRKNAFEHASQQVEIGCLHKLNYIDSRGNAVPKYDAVNSIMKGVQISDSKPLPWDCLTLCAKLDYETNGQYKSINIARECIRPGTEIESTLTLDTKILAGTGINKSSIQEMIHRFYAIQNRYFLSKFMPDKTMDKTESNGCELFLGGGTGYVSKTIMYPVLKENGLSLTAQLMQKQFPNHYHLQDVVKGVSPHMMKCTKYEGKIYRMGRCEVSIL